MKRIITEFRELMNTENYIYGDGQHARHMITFFESVGIPVKGAVRAYYTHKMVNGKKVVDVEDIQENENAVILLTQTRWQREYDELYELIDSSRIYILGTWLPSGKCIMCENKETFASDAAFFPFLTERMFSGENKSTQIIHCPKCRTYYSQYRPTDDEMDLLYSGYRDENYQKLRQKYEPEYTVEFNQNLYAPSDGGYSRKHGIYDFIKDYIDLNKIEVVLDFGGDKGQFIPDELFHARKYVYEISGTETVEGVIMINDYNGLKERKPDLTMCNMVLEHVSDVREYFKLLVDLMPEQSYLYIEVPFEAYIENSEYCLIHEHINFFREKLFRILAEQYRVEIAAIEQTSEIIRILYRK